MFFYKGICAYTSLLGLGGVLLFGAGPGVAQEAEDAETSVRTFDTVTVTAQKREEDINQVGMSISAFSGEDLALAGVSGVDDLALLVPGFTASDSGQNVPVYSLRGIALNEASLAANAPVALYMDEVPLVYGSMARGMAFDLQRVEVLKGPQGTLYGTNSTGGAINFIANAPTDEFEAGISASYGSFSTFEGNAFASGPLSNTIQARLAVSAVQGDDWQKSVSRDDENGQKNLFNGRFQLAWQPTSTLDFTFNLNGWRDKSDTSAFQLQQVEFANPSNAGIVPPQVLGWVGDPPPEPDDPRKADWDPGADLARDDSFLQGFVRGDWSVAPSAVLTSITSYSDYQSEAYQDRDGTQFLIHANEFDSEVSSFYQEVRASISVGAADWIVGANYRNDEVSESYFNLLPDASTSQAVSIDFSAATIDAQTDIDSWGIFANLDYEISSSLSATLGARYSVDERAVTQCVYDDGEGGLASIFTIIANATRAAQTPPLPAVDPIAPGGCTTLSPDLEPTPFNGSLEEDNVSWRAAVNWEPFDSTLIYGSVSKGFKAGSFPTISATSHNQFSAAVQESVVAYEIGIKSELIPGVLRANSAAFLYDYKDQQVRGRGTDPNFGLVALLVNVPKSEIQGAEAELVWQPANAFSLTGSATYLDTKVVEYTGFDLNAGVVRDFEGENLPYSPEWSINIAPHFEYPVSDNAEIFADANYAYRDKSSAFFGDDPRVALPSYETVSASLGIRDRNNVWSLSVWGENLTNEYYWTNVHRSIDTLVRIGAAPQTFGIRLNYKY